MVLCKCVFYSLSRWKNLTFTFRQTQKFSKQKVSTELSDSVQCQGTLQYLNYFHIFTIHHNMAWEEVCRQNVTKDSSACLDKIKIHEHCCRKPNFVCNSLIIESQGQHALIMWCYHTQKHIRVRNKKVGTYSHTRYLP